MEKDEVYMSLALEEAKKAMELGEVPIGAVLVWTDPDGKERVISSAYNCRETKKNALGHAECMAIGKGCEVMKGWRLHRAVLYVTLEPCPMCAGAIVNARIPRVVIGTKDPKGGAFGSVLDLNAFPLNHKPEIVYGVLEKKCRDMLTDFFHGLRKNENRSPKTFQPPLEHK